VSSWLLEAANFQSSHELAASDVVCNDVIYQVIRIIHRCRCLCIPAAVSAVAGNIRPHDNTQTAISRKIIQSALQLLEPRRIWRVFAANTLRQFIYGVLVIQTTQASVQSLTFRSTHRLNRSLRASQSLVCRTNKANLQHTNARKPQKLNQTNRVMHVCQCQCQS